MSNSDAFLAILLSFIAGIFISPLFNIPMFIFWEFLALGFAFLLFSNKKVPLIAFSLCFILFSLGGFYYHFYNKKLANNGIKNYYDQRIVAEGTIVSEPKFYNGTLKITVKTKSINSRTIQSKILIKTRTNSSYQYGDKIKAIGKLVKPPIYQDFNYQNYLKTKKILGLMNYPQLILISKNNGSNFYASILKAKQEFRNKINKYFSYPENLFLRAIILGDKQDIPSSWKNKLNAAGLRHIVCISGMHIIVLIYIFLWLGIIFGLARPKAFYFAVAFLWLYIILVGFQPSIIRAGIMGTLYLFCQKIGREKASLQALVLAAFLMLLFNPLLLNFDAGFQLSFLATLGIIYFTPLFRELFQKFKIFNSFGIANVLSITLAAQIFTIPILIYNFGYFSLVSPLTNVLVVPILPYIMASGFIFLAASFLGQFFALLSLIPVFLLLNYLIKIVSYFSSLKYAFIVLSLPWQALILYYFCLGGLIYALKSFWQKKFSLIN